MRYVKERQEPPALVRVVSWNVNSVRARLLRLLALLDRHEPDVVCLQETKVPNASFPVMELGAAGYRLLLHGQLSYNGVAILVRDSARRGGLAAFDVNAPSRGDAARKGGPGALTEVRRGFPRDPALDQSRVVSACVGGLRLVNVYVVNGTSTESEQFRIKRLWMAALGEWLRSLPKEPPLLVVGDFNVAPDDRDVWDPEGLRDRIHCTDEERAWLQQLQGKRLGDLLRATTEKAGFHTWWPYQRGAFERDEGLRFDLALGDRAVVDRIKGVWIDRDERRPSFRPERPSDHAPLLVDLAGF